jgi:hypothetical protein
MTENVAESNPREDDRNEDVDDSPAPDPTTGDTDEEDNPGAD